jgi:cytochrome c oxidase subunit 2
MARWSGVAAMAAVGLASSACGRGMLDTHTPEAKHIALLWWVMFAISMAVFIAVGALLLYALFRPRRGGPGRFERSSSTQMLFITIGGAAIPLVILIVVFGFTVGVMAASRPGDSGLQVHVTGHDFWWEVRYPDGNVTAQNEIHVPVGREIDFTLESSDVIHSFWVPQLNGKTDMVPGQTNHMSIRVTSPGTFRGECAEFCGIGHACMTFVVVAEPQEQFDAWLASQRPPAGDPQEFKDGDCAGRSAGAVQAAPAAGPPSDEQASLR